jgi:hypothetical protein
MRPYAPIEGLRSHDPSQPVTAVNSSMRNALKRPLQQRLDAGTAQQEMHCELCPLETRAAKQEPEYPRRQAVPRESVPLRSEFDSLLYATWMMLFVRYLP